jgi:hypothetical protein
MALVFPNNGEGKALGNIVNKVTPENLSLRLYTSNTTPGETDTTATYTEASGSGYAAITLTGSSWTVSEGAPSDASYAQQTFTFSGALGNVYGYFVIGGTDGVIRWAERFSDGPYNIQNNGDQIKITPKITGD